MQTKLSIRYLDGTTGQFNSSGFEIVGGHTLYLYNERWQAEVIIPMRQIAGIVASYDE